MSKYVSLSCLNGMIAVVPFSVRERLHGFASGPPLAFRNPAVPGQGTLSTPTSSMAPSRNDLGLAPLASLYAALVFLHSFLAPSGNDLGPAIHIQP